MATITLNQNYVYVTDAPSTDISSTEISNSEDYNTVKIANEKFEWDYTKESIVIPVPRAKGQLPAQTVSGKVSEGDLNDKTWIVDLKLKRSVTVQGKLPEETAETAYVKFGAMDVLIRQGKTVRLIKFKGSNQKVLNVGFNNVKITETTGRYTDEDAISAEDLKYDINATFVIGEDR